MRAGIGFDFHPFERGEGIVLGGITIPSNLRLKGHSDADVVIHAIVDALLGAAALGDIGEYFPPSDDRWKDVSSMIFLERTVKLLQDKGYRILNVDVTYIGEEPRLGKYKRLMAENLSSVLNAPVNIKATTMEGMGIIGNREGAAAVAVALIEEEADG